MEDESRPQARSFGWTARITEQMEEMPDDVAAEYCMIVVMYGSYGIEPVGCSWPVMAAFRGIKEDIDNSIAYRERGKKGGRPKKDKEVKTSNETGFNQNKKSENGLKPPAEEVLSQIETGSAYSLAKPSLAKPIEKEEKESFSLQCLKALNEELRGVAPVEFTRNPNGEYIASLDGRFTVEDVREMVRFKRNEWEGTRFQQNLNPITLFSPEKFESYVIASKMREPTKSTSGRKVMDDELASYAS
jgi:uncharacterized phage protein (TIGR02220 family)